MPNRPFCQAAHTRHAAGTYPKKPKLPAVGGNEGVGEVISVGKDVRSVQPGDWVIPSHVNSGTWCTHKLAYDGDLIRLPKGLSVEAAASIAVNPCTAYRMLHDFAPLRKGTKMWRSALLRQ